MGVVDIHQGDTFKLAQFVSLVLVVAIIVMSCQGDLHLSKDKVFMGVADG
jgi:hypothetical protein